MMSRTDDLIDALTLDAAPVKPARPPWQTLLGWLCVTAVATLVFILFSAPRPDLMAQLSSPLYVSELVTLAAIILTSALSAIWLCFPDLRQRRWVVFLPLLGVWVFTGLTAYRTMHPEMNAGEADASQMDFHCGLCITILALAPGLWMFHVMRKNATLYPRIAGSIALLASAGVGLFVLKIIEQNDAPMHLMLSHVLPMLILGGLGGWLGQKRLKW